MLNFSDKCKRFYFKIQVSQQKDRVETILKTTQRFLSARNHKDLYMELRNSLPETFSYEHSGVLFYEISSDNLYWIFGLD